jgi:hypothetical protein
MATGAVRAVDAEIYYEVHAGGPRRVRDIGARDAHREVAHAGG